VLFNEPKLLKFIYDDQIVPARSGFSALQRAEIAEISDASGAPQRTRPVSVLFNEPKLLKFRPSRSDANTS